MDNVLGNKQIFSWLLFYFIQKHKSFRLRYIADITWPSGNACTLVWREIEKIKSRRCWQLPADEFAILLRLHLHSRQKSEIITEWRLSLALVHTYKGKVQICRLLIWLFDYCIDSWYCASSTKLMQISEILKRVGAQRPSLKTSRGILECKNKLAVHG